VRKPLGSRRTKGKVEQAVDCCLVNIEKAASATCLQQATVQVVNVQVERVAATDMGGADGGFHEGPLEMEIHTASGGAVGGLAAGGEHARH